MLWPNDFLNDEVFIAWALACIDDDSKAASWKAHWLTLRTESIGAGRAQPVTLADWDTCVREFLGKFTNPSEMQRMQRHLVEMRQKGSCRDHTQEFNRTALLSGMNGNQALPWLFHQSLKNDIQRELLHETFNTLEQLQSATIATDDLLFSFRKQNPGDQTTNRKPKVRQPNVLMPQENSPTNDPNAMELDHLSTDEYWKRQAGGLCFKCRKKGLTAIAHNTTKTTAPTIIDHNRGNISNEGRDVYLPSKPLPNTPKTKELISLSPEYKSWTHENQKRPPHSRTTLLKRHRIFFTTEGKRPHSLGRKTTECT